MTRRGDPPIDPEVLALRAVAFLMSEPGLAERYLAVTGLRPAEFRAGIGDRQTLASVLGFLEADERDLVACADRVGATPAELVAARERLDATP